MSESKRGMKVVRKKLQFVNQNIIPSFHTLFRKNKIPRQKSQAFLVISTKPIIVVNTYTEEEPKEILKNLIKSNGELRRL